MQPDSLPIPHSVLQVLSLVLASSLGWIGGWITRRKREPAEIAKLSAETRQISINTDVSLIQAATAALTKAERLQDERDHWERKANDLQMKVIQAEADARAAEMFVDQLHAAAKLAGVRLRDYSPQQLNPPKPE